LYQTRTARALNLSTAPNNPNRITHSPQIPYTLTVTDSMSGIPLAAATNEVLPQTPLKVLRPRM